MSDHEPAATPAVTTPVPMESDSNRRELLQHVLSALPKAVRHGDNVQLDEFVHRYYENLPIDELSVLAAEDLAGAALSHWQLLERHRDEPTITVLNPRFEQHGWQSAHTVLQIVANDQPWLLSSLRSALTRANHGLHMILHPILAFDSKQNIWTTSSHDPQAVAKSLIHIELDAMDASAHSDLIALIQNVFALLRAVQIDADAMAIALQQSGSAIDNREQAAFIAWLDQRQFACLAQAQLTLDNDSAINTSHHLGLFNPANHGASWQLEDIVPPDIHNIDFSSGESLLMCKATCLSPLIRDEYAELILLPSFDADGKLDYLLCTVGLFVTGLQNEAVSNIPWLSERVQRVITASGVHSDSHDGKAIAATLRSLPREMLMQTGSLSLLKMATGIVGLQERQRVKLFHSTDTLGRFCNCLIYIPRDSYSRDLRLAIEKILLSYIDGISASFDTRFSSESALARLHFVINKRSPQTQNIDWQAIEDRIHNAAISWSDRLESTLRERHDELKAVSLGLRYCNAFPVAYTEDYSARAAAADIEFIEQQLHGEAPIMSFYRHIVADSGTVNFKLFARNHSVSLSDVIPIIENMGLRVESEHPFEVRPKDEAAVWIHEFTVTHSSAELTPSTTTDTSATRIQQAFNQIWQGNVENDGFNRLILEAALDWRQVVVLRALCKYLLQIDVPFSQSYMIDSLVSNVAIARQIIELFELRFDPAHPDAATREQATINLLTEIDQALEAVDSLDEDRILRSYRDLVMATLRCNVFVNDAAGEYRDFLSFKFDSAHIRDLPKPVPMAEIFVYSAQVEGIHLRGGKVARGGLRWSDRREDFRTEVLALMKAQMVKNAVIVPLGSKGGFYVKAELPAERDAMMQVVINCYRTFLKGLLDVTDNIVADEIRVPANVIRYDDNDPYLVVAADKGTATFSDYANEVSAEYDFWLDDAFASGGSAGYDHKKMGITARGAWESVKRHFRNLGHNTQTSPFTVAGIGDMAGDVFGNGMLLSSHIRLVAAFNHQHIFIDPDPDPAITHAERQRLFELPRSSWSDYDQSLISTGGGIYSRSDKQIILSSEARLVLGTDQSALTPTELISVILQAPVDLLWNGGIGTYVKACNESHADAADRANDTLRVNGRDLRCQVIGEGGNLGLTQRARIEYARKGGLIYTDAIDNSAGVDCSDHEVNIKVLLNAVVANQDLTVKQRDELLESMTDTVATLVLADNYLQTQCIDMTHIDGVQALNEQTRFMQHLENQGLLDRTIEYLPDSDEIAERLANDEGLARPEIAVLVSYSKMVTYQELMASASSHEPALARVLQQYFPAELQQRYASEITSHRLRSEIINTVVTNELINRLGPTFVFRMHQELNVSATDIAHAFLIVREAFRLPDLWQSIESLDNKIDADEQYRMQMLVRGLVERATHWLLRARRPAEGIDALVERYQDGLDELIAAMPDCLAKVQRDTLEQRINHFKSAGAPDDIALAVARVVPMSSSLDIIEIAQSLNQPVADVASIYFAIGHHLELTWLRDQIALLQVNSHWHTLATSELRSDLHYQQRHLSAEVASGTDTNDSAQQRVAAWADRHRTATEKYQALITDMKANTSIDFAMLSLAVNEVHKLLRSDRPLAS